MCGAAWCGCLGPRSRARRLCVLRCASVTPHLGAPQGKKLEISPPLNYFRFETLHGKISSLDAILRCLLRHSNHDLIAKEVKRDALR